MPPSGESSADGGTDACVVDLDPASRGRRAACGRWNSRHRARRRCSPTRARLRCRLMSSSCWRSTCPTRWIRRNRRCSARATSPASRRGTSCRRCAAGSTAKWRSTYFEWAGPYDQKIVVPWRLIDGPEAADAFANEIARAPYRRASRTSISGALNFAKPLFDGSGYRGFRRVIDVSGDGANNSGPFVTIVRDDVLAAGITINGLPIMLKRPNCVHDGYRQSRYLLRGLRDRRPRRVRHPDPRARAIQGGDPHQAGAGDRRPHARAALVPVQASAPRVSCTIGEQMWRDRWGN